MIILLVFLMTIIVMTFYLVLLRRTVFGFSVTSVNYTGFYIFYSLVVHVLPSSILLNMFSIERFWVAFKVEQESVLWITCLILWAVFTFIFCLYIISRLSVSYFKLYDIVTHQNQNTLFFVNIIILFCFALIYILWLCKGVGHSFLLSFLSGESISLYRHKISLINFARYSKHFFTFITPFVTIIVASGQITESRLKQCLYLLCILFIASWGGAKGPFINILIMFFISKSLFLRKKIGLRYFVILVSFSILVSFMIYKIVIFQYPALKSFSHFLDYFCQRVFVAQMIGVYEQFNLWLHNSLYIFHGVPFASFFTDFPQFHKDLMLISEDRIDPNSIGIKNTLFIAEAYAMGGWPLLTASPFIMALNLSISYVWMVFLLNRLSFMDFEFSKRVVALALFSYVGITGGFSDLIFFKTTVMLTIFLLPFIALQRAFIMIKTFLKKINRRAFVTPHTRKEQVSVMFAE